MKQTLLVAIASAAVGGAVGSLMTSAASREAPVVAGRSDLTADAIGAAVAKELRPLLASSRRDVSDRSATAAPIETPAPRSIDATEAPSAAPRAAAAGARLPVREVETADAPPPNLERLHDMVAA